MYPSRAWTRASGMESATIASARRLVASWVTSRISVEAASGTGVIAGRVVSGRHPASRTVRGRRARRTSVQVRRSAGRMGMGRCAGGIHVARRRARIGRGRGVSGGGMLGRILSVVVVRVFVPVLLTLPVMVVAFRPLVQLALQDLARHSGRMLEDHL